MKTARYALMFACGCGAPLMAHAASPSMDELQKHLANLRHEYNDLTARMHVVGVQLTAAEESVATLEARLADNPKDISTVWQALQRARTQVTVLEFKYAQLQDDLIILMPRIRRVERLIEFLRDQDDPGD